MPATRILGIAAAIGFTLTINQPLAAQIWPSQLTNTPTLVQDAFGAGGFLLPNDGLEYCVPTSTSMSLLYLGNAGFTQIAPANSTMAQQLNMVRIMGGLMQTSPGGGTNTDNKLTGMATYLAACGLGAPTTITTNNGNITGLSNATYSLSIHENPTVAEMNTFFQPPFQTGQITVAQLGIGWFKPSGGDTYTRSGGHGIALLGVQDVANQQVLINNPEPHSLAQVPDLPNYVTQHATLGPHVGTLVGVNGNPLVVTATQYGPHEGTTQAVIQLAARLTISESALPSNFPAIVPWQINGVQTINTNGGDLNVVAALQDGASPGGFTKSGAGVLTLSNLAVPTTTGAFAVLGGKLFTPNATATPLGSGSVTIGSGTLALAPSVATSISQTLASGANSQLSYSGGGVIELTPGSGQNLTVTVGGSSNGSQPNLVRSGSGTLAIAPTNGIAQLGSSVRFVSAGSGNNLPPTVNGIVSPCIVGQDTPASSASGDFLTYSANGFGVASYVSSLATPINSSSVTANTVYAAENSQTVASGTTVSTYALKVGTATSGPVVIGSGGGTTTLAVGPQSGSQAGVILNGGTIATSVLQFGGAEALVFSSSAGGTISSQIQGNGGLTKFGPGTLTLAGDNVYTGPTTVQSGTLAVTGSLGTAGLPTPVTVNTAATLSVAGSGGIVRGPVVALNGGAVNLAGGTLGAPAGGGGPVSTLLIDAYSTVQGSGTLHAAATINGFVAAGSAPGRMTFTGPTTMTGTSFILWKLFELADNHTPNPNGNPWNSLDFTGPGSGLHLGTPGMGNDVHIALDLSSVPDPNSDDAFWDQEHRWTLITFAQTPTQIALDLSAAAFIQGKFSLNTSDPTSVVIQYTPVPEPSAFVLLAAAGIGFRMISRRRRIAASRFREFNSNTIC